MLTTDFGKNNGIIDVDDKEDLKVSGVVINRSGGSLLNLEKDYRFYSDIANGYKARVEVRLDSPSRIIGNSTWTFEQGGRCSVNGPHPDFQGEC